MTDQSTLDPGVVSVAGLDASAEQADLGVRQIYSGRAQQMFGFARRLGLSDDDAADAVQETMLRLWRELESGTQVADPEAWAFRALYRLAIDGHRLRRRLHGLIDRMGSRAMATEGRTGSGDPAQTLEVDSIWREVDRLPERQRAVLYLRYRADLPYERIGLALSITPGTARGHASTGLATLRLRLSQEGEP
jgi:RNA polymerase sigma-70 factor (ECF subfamily)